MSDTEARKLESVQVLPDVVYGHKMGMALTFDLFQPQERNGAAVLFMNSGGFESGRLRQCTPVEPSGWRFLEPGELTVEPEGEPAPPLRQFSFADLLSNGFSVFDVRHGSSPKFMLDEIVADVRRAVRFIRYHAAEFDIDPDRIGVWGASAGGYLTILLGLTADSGNPDSRDAIERTSNDIQAVVAYYPAGFDWVKDVRRFPELAQGLPSIHIDEALLASLSIKECISPDGPPTLIIYGEEDFPFITEASASMSVALQESGVACKCIAIPGTAHEFSGEGGYHAQHGERAMSELLAWFQAHLVSS